MRPFVADPDFTLYHGDVRDILPTLDPGSVDCCVTSPPYWGLRDYGVDGQLGLEGSPEEYVEAMVAVFRDVRRALADTGTLWLNLGDSYNAYNGNRGISGSTLEGSDRPEARPKLPRGHGLSAGGLKQKDMVMIPARVALALQADGWYLRADIIWSKPNPMPESVTDRPTKAHEYVFLLSKQPRYYYDAAAIAEEFADERMGNPGTYARTSQASKGANNDRADTGFLNHGAGWNADGSKDARNKRSVWTVATTPYPDAHFATFPPALIEPCILAGCPTGGVVLDPFMGSGTTALVARKHGRRSVGVELNADYAAMCARRLGQQSLLAEVSA